MIDHNHKCIFIHIPRTAGTSIEEWIAGEDWWKIDASSKHLTASQAKSRYADYWHGYFKFSIVREPISRVISCLKYHEHFGLSLDADGKIDFSKYLKLFGNPVVLEHDRRFYSRADLVTKNHKAQSIYGNILDEELDFIAKYENLKEDSSFIGDSVGLNVNFEIHTEIFEDRPLRDNISKSSISDIMTLYDLDYKRFYPDIDLNNI